MAQGVPLCTPGMDLLGPPCCRVADQIGRQWVERRALPCPPDAFAGAGYLAGVQPLPCDGDSGGPLLLAPNPDDPATHMQVERGRGRVLKGLSCAAPNAQALPAAVHTRS